jgi:hypothetical protein
MRKSNAQPPRISVIISFADPRGRPRHILSWTRKQNCAAADFEVIVVGKGRNPEEEREIAAYLRPCDRQIRTDAANRFSLYDIGARAASGELLFLTEDHCVAEPSCLAEVLRFFGTHDAPAAFMHSGHINHTALARLEQRVYERCLPLWLSPGYWDKVRIRSFVIRRSIYFSAGGLPGRYDHFSEAILSARLHDGGHTVDYIPALGVRHINTPSWRFLYEDVATFVRGECLFREREDPDFCERYFQLLPEWSERFFASRRQSIVAAWLAARTLCGNPRRLRNLGGLTALVRELCGRLAVAVTGPRWLLLSPLLSLLAARFRCAWWRWDERRQVQAYADVWERLTHYCRVRYVVEHAGDDGPVAGVERHRYDMAEVSQRTLVGFHTRETCGGKTFRWSGPLALLRLHVSPGNYQVTLDTGSLRGAGCSFPYGLFWNGRRIARKSIRVEAGRIVFPIERTTFVPGPEQRLSIVCAPLQSLLRRSADHRRLGLPVCSVEFRQAAEAAGPLETRAA